MNIINILEIELYWLACFPTALKSSIWSLVVGVHSFPRGRCLCLILGDVCWQQTHFHLAAKKSFERINLKRRFTLISTPQCPIQPQGRQINGSKYFGRRCLIVFVHMAAVRSDPPHWRGLPASLWPAERSGQTALPDDQIQVLLTVL